MMNVGEELVASYLQYVMGCEFTSKNLYTRDEQGEIDVVGVNLKDKSIYMCEVAIHLTTGLRYVKDKRPHTLEKLKDKFSRDIKFARSNYPDYKLSFMLWSPIVKGGKPNAQENQLEALDKLNAYLMHEFGVQVELVVNNEFLSRIKELREFAASRKEEIKCPLLRLLQIEALLQKHVGKNLPPPDSAPPDDSEDALTDDGS